MTRPFRLLTLLMFFLLTGCLLTVDPVVGPDDAHEIPGLAGHWKSADGALEIFLRANPDGSYSFGTSADEVDQLWRVMDLEASDYVVETLRDGTEDDAGMLLVFSLYPGHLFLQTDWDTSLIDHVADSTGLQVETDQHSSIILPGQPKELVLATLKALNNALGPYDKKPLIRQGGFVEPGGEKNSVTAMDQLLERSEMKAAIEMARYLSDRGAVRAQVTLMNLATSGVIDRAEGIFHGLRAIKSAKTSGEEELADLYVRPQESGALIDTSDAQRALYWLSRAQLDNPNANIEQKIQNLADEICSEDNSDGAKDCPDNISTYWHMRANATQEMHEASAALAESLITQALIKSEMQRIQQKKQELERERQAILEELGEEALREGEQYALGQGVSVDHVRAVELFRESASYGNAEAQYKLGWMLEKGMGTPKDEAEALSWYYKAAAQGHSMATNNIGGLFDDGRGTQADQQEAFRWYQKAAELGLAHGHFNVAIAYRDGAGVDPDLEQSRNHFQIAQREGVPGAAEHLADVERRLARTSASPLKPCGEPLQQYLTHQFGILLHSLDVGCMHAMSEREQTFTAGMSTYFVNRCGHPSDPQKRSRLQGFLTASGFVISGGRQYSNPNPLEMISDQLDSAAVFTMGTQAGDEIGCNELSERLSANIVAYLDQTALGEPDKPSYVDGCVARYARQYSRTQCECVANIGRSVFPDLHRKSFSPDSIKAIIHSNPLLGFQLMFQCGVVDY